MRKEFTATVYVLHEMRALMHLHQKHGKWLPPGGHVEENELPTEAAIREVKEESGLDIVLTSSENIWVSFPHAKSIERPYLCLVENIPERKHAPFHQHIDFIYLAKPVGNTNPLPGFSWLSLSDIQNLPEKEIFPDTVLIVNQILQSTNERESAPA